MSVTQMSGLVFQAYRLGEHAAWRSDAMAKARHAASPAQRTLWASHARKLTAEMVRIQRTLRQYEGAIEALPS